jgi:alpha-L-fucosidase
MGDKSYPASQAAALRVLFQTLQPGVVAFGAAGLCASPARWVGTEEGYAPYPCWSTVNTISDDGAGTPDGALWIPAETDFTLQNGDNWFYNPAAGVHDAAHLIDMYETSAGHNTALIIDFAPKPDGSLPPEQVAAAAALGAYVAACYSTPLVQGAGNASIITLTLPAPTVIDRVLVAENIGLGQLVRAFLVTATLGNGSVAVLANGSSIGAKFIQVLAANATVTSLTLNVTGVAATGPPGAPYIAIFAAFACDALVDAAGASLAAAGFPQDPRGAVSATASARAAEALARATSSSRMRRATRVF